jgi:hypothetical protein
VRDKGKLRRSAKFYRLVVTGHTADQHPSLRDTERRAARAERARLIARIAEIDATLSADQQIAV